jgi:hypothetical protein
MFIIDNELCHVTCVERDKKKNRCHDQQHRKTQKQPQKPSKNLVTIYKKKKLKTIKKSKNRIIE